MGSRGTWVSVMVFGMVSGTALASDGCSFDPTGAATAPTPIEASDAGAAATDATGPGAPAADAAGPLSQRGVVVSRRGTPELDGDGSDWAGVEIHELDVGTADHTHAIAPRYQPSLTVRFAWQHDDDRLYLWFDVHDDRVVPASTPLYEDDSVTVLLDAAGDRSGPYGPDDHELVLGSNGTYADYAGGQLRVVGFVGPTLDGWQAEIGIDRASLGVARLPPVLGFSLAATDDDGFGGSDADFYAVWYRREGVAPCPTCCEGTLHAESWCDTTLLGELVLE